MDSPRIYIFRTYETTAASLTTSGLTLGNSYMSVRIPEEYRNDFQQDLDITHYPGGSQIFRWGQVKKDSIVFEGFVQENTPTSTITVKVAADQYIKDRLSSSTNPEGFVVKLTPTVYDKFSDLGSNARDVVRGALESLSTRWGKDENLGFYVNGVFKPAWRS